MVQAKLIQGHLYYDCGIRQVEESDPHVIDVCTWRYDGLMRGERTSPDCDQPYHYHQFTEYRSYLYGRNKPDSERRYTSIRFPSEEKALDRMLDSNAFYVELTGAFEELGFMETLAKDDTCMSCGTPHCEAVISGLGHYYVLCDDCCKTALSALPGLRTG